MYSVLSVVVHLSSPIAEINMLLAVHYWADIQYNAKKVTCETVDNDCIVFFSNFHSSDVIHSF